MKLYFIIIITLLVIKSMLIDILIFIYYENIYFGIEILVHQMKTIEPEINIREKFHISMLN